MVDPTPDPIDRAYSQSERLLAEQNEGSARRARVLAAVEQETVIRPISRPKSTSRDTSRGVWLVAASVLIASGVLVTRFFADQQWSSQPIGRGSVAQLAEKDQMTAALSPPAPKTDQAEPLRFAPKSKASDQAPTLTPARRESTRTRMALASPPPAAELSAAAPPLGAASAVPPPAAPLPRVILSAPPPPLTATRAAPAIAMAAPPPPAAAAPAVAAPPPAAAAPSPPAPAPAPPPMPTASKPIGELRGNFEFGQLRAAAAAGRTSEVQELLNRQMPVDAADVDGETALMKSIRADQPGTAALLIRHGASLDKKNNAGLNGRDLAGQVNDPALDRALGMEH